jgi:thymidylate synthase (FAD)
MKIVKQDYSILYPKNAEDWRREAKLIELAGRTAHKSEDRITPDSYDRFIRDTVVRGPEAVIGFGSMAVRFVTSLGLSHEIVRHSTYPFAQESTRYCNYDEDRFGRELTVIKPSTWDSWSEDQRDWWKESLEYAELNYLYMVQDDMEPQDARSVLPGALKNEVVIRANFHEWRHIFRLRAISKAAHPDMRALMIPLYERCRGLLPCVFDMGKPE